MTKPSPREPPVITTRLPRQSNRRFRRTRARASYKPAKAAEAASANFVAECMVIDGFYRWGEVRKLAVESQSLSEQRLRSSSITTHLPLICDFAGTVHQARKITRAREL